MIKDIIYIIDAHGFIHRAYHALPKLTSKTLSMEVGALYGFANFLLALARDRNPQYIAVCFDSPGKNFRHQMYPEYKANRKKTDEELVAQLKLARDMATMLGFKITAKEGFEADDILAFFAENAPKKGLDAVLVTSDKDACQLISDNVKILTGLKENLRGADYALEKFGLKPEALRDYFALTGDASDNIKGIAGIGPKTAAQLLNKYQTLEGIITAAENKDPEIKPALAEKIIKGKEDALLSRKLVSLNGNLGIEFEPSNFTAPVISDDKFIELAQKYGFKSIAERNINPKETELKLPAMADFSTAVTAVEKSAAVVVLCADGCICVGAEETFSVKDISALTTAEHETIKQTIINPRADIITYDLKEIIRALKIYDVPIPKSKNIFDLMIMAYCLDPAREGRYPFENIAFERTGYNPPAVSDKDNLLSQAMQAEELKRIIFAELEEKNLISLYRDTELPLIFILAEMETAGIQTDKELLKNFRDELEQKISALDTEIQDIAGEAVNINSPKQVAHILFEKMGLKPARKTKTGLSTDEEVLRKLNTPVTNKILEYREYTKLKTTYADALLELADENTDRIHTHFDQTGTSTGRLSSLGPNMQNIPVRTALGQTVRRAFCAPGGYNLLTADYSQIDLRVLAHESGDKELISAFERDADIHAETAAGVFGTMPGMVTDDMRQKAKAINFGIVYGQTGMGLSQALDIGVKEAQEYINQYFARYKRVKEWINETHIFVSRNGFVKTLSGRIRYFPELKNTDPDKPSYAQRAAVNTVIQGGSADIIKLAMIEIYNGLNDFGAKMLLQVHDELVFEVSQNKTAEFAALVKNKMENAVKLKVPLKAKIETGKNWQDTDEFQN